MNGVHDMGGMQGYGPVQAESGEPLFHAAWERRALGLTLAMGACGAWNIDQSRFARESLPAAVYLGSSYYRIWILALERLLLARGLVGNDELTAGCALQPALPVARVLRADTVASTLARGAPTLRDSVRGARFTVGQRVRTANIHPAGHTRLPRYARGHVGVVTAAHGAHVFADRNAASASNPPADDTPEWLYTVVFEGRELWGKDAEAGTRVSIDAWEPYLAAADESAA